MAVGTTEAGVGSTSPVNIMANIFISFIGAGVLGLPFAFKEAGILEGVCIMSLVGLISVKAMLLLIDCKYRLIRKTTQNSSPTHANSNGSVKFLPSLENIPEEKEDLIPAESSVTVEEPVLPQAPGQDLNYGDLGYYAIGPLGRHMVDIAIIVSQIGFCCAYLIFISENLSDYISGLKLIHWLCVLLPPLSVLTLLRHLSSLALSSLFAQLSNLLAFAVVFWFDFEHFSKIEISPKEISLRGFPFFLAVAMYCYEGAGMILSLESSLAKEIRHTFKFYFKSTISVVTLLYITFGVCGYLSFGPDTNPIITLNLPKGYGLDFAMVVKSCLCLALFFTYPVMMFPVIKLVEKHLFDDPGLHIWKGNILRFLLVALTGMVVLEIPNFANLMALVGSTCCTMLAFIMPGLFHMRIFKGSLTMCDFLIDAMLIALGVAGAIVGTWDAMKRMQESPEVEEAVTTIISNLTDVANTTILTNSSVYSTATSVESLSRQTFQNVTAAPQIVKELIDNVTTILNGS